MAHVPSGLTLFPAGVFFTAVGVALGAVEEVGVEVVFFCTVVVVFGVDVVGVSFFTALESSEREMSSGVLGALWAVLDEE